MPESTRLKGTTLSLTIDGVERMCDITSYEIRSEDADSDLVTFCQAAEGGAFNYVMTISAITSSASASFWRYAWANAGETDIAYVVAPNGNEDPTADQPHYSGTLSVPGGMPTLANEANTDASFDIEFKLDGRPLEVTS